MLKHLAIIPDGNRRYAKKSKLSIEKIYSKAMNKVFEIIDWCKESEVKTLTIWGFSTENWKRSGIEKKILFKLFEEKGKEILSDKKINRERVKVIGNIKQFPENLQKLFRNIEEKTRKNNKFNLNILLNYGGREEIVQAVNQILSKGKKRINEKDFKENLWLQDEPELIIRTSGEQRLSGVLPFQSTYSELCFVKKYFPELTKKDFLKIIKNFEKRKRRFGK